MQIPLLVGETVHGLSMLRPRCSSDVGLLTVHSTICPYNCIRLGRKVPALIPACCSCCYSTCRKGYSCLPYTRRSENLQCRGCMLQQLRNLRGPRLARHALLCDQRAWSTIQIHCTANGGPVCDMCICISLCVSSGYETDTISGIQRISILST